ncbi:T9SS type A sorting domain-containing protein [Mesonia aquimarina]|uniref:T9SS type A sorting domain-containing protein n=1 Tax=Mesonia aquimarina TaxID=1504967 RepID=UPI000EF59C33|nr:T9SS type A sorting domain-containing protein [Mesonia aquimarina]
MKKITFIILLCFCWSAYAQVGPIEVTGFNEDVIANGVGPMSESTSIPIDADSFCYLSEDWKLNEGDADITVGLPATGLISSQATTGLTYQVPTEDEPYEGNNSLRIDQAGVDNGGTFTLTTPEKFSILYFLVTSGSGSSTIKATVNFEDGTTQEFTGLSIPDWYQTGLPVEISGIGRGDISNNNVETPFNNPKLFQLTLEISVANQAKNIETIDFEKTNTGEAVFNAIAVSGEQANDCLAPYDIAVSDVTMTEAEISWESIPEIDEWEIEYGEIGFELGNGTIVEDTDGAIGETLESLSAATQYEVYVRSICDDGSESVDVGPVSFNTPICDPLEQCNYTFVLSDQYGYGWYGSVMEVRQNGITVATLQSPGGEGMNVEVPICDGYDFELFWSNAGTWSSIVEIEIKDSFGTTIYTKNAGEGTAGTTLFSTTASCPESPENDNLESAISLDLNAECTGDLYHNVSATSQEGEPIPSCYLPEDTIDNTIWFSFVAPEVGAVVITTDIDPSDFDSQLAVYNAPSNVNDLSTLTEVVACNQDISEENTTSRLEITGLTAGNTYYIQVDGKQNSQGNFCIVVNEIPCPDPSGIEITNIMGNSAQINWESNGIETSWEIEYGIPGFSLGNGTVIVDEDEPEYLLNELSIDTAYEVYIRAICDGEAGNPIGPVSFTTPPCPENIEVLVEEGNCSAIVTYNAPQSADGGPSENLIVNPSGEDGLDGWTIDANGGSGWAAQNGGFVTSYSNCEKSQIIDLGEAGFSNDQMDSAPTITISEDYQGTSSNKADKYFLIVELRDSEGNVVVSFDSGEITTDATSQTITHTFSNYGSGVRSIYFLHGGRDAEGWGGNFGSKMKNAQVLVNLPAIEVIQTEGLANGEEFPIGITTNVFEITQGEEEPLICSFEVNVLDVEEPNAVANDISIEMTEGQMVSLTPEDIDAGSTDNCEISSMSLDVVSLNCDNLGENEVLLTVIDASGNTSIATATVTLTDPNQFCELSVGQAKELSFNIYPNPTQGDITIETNANTINKVEIYDVNGRLIKLITPNSNKVFNSNISNFNAGVYFVKIYGDNNTSVVKQLIKE